MIDKTGEARLAEIIYEHTKFGWTESTLLSGIILTAIKEDKVPGVGGVRRP